LRHPGLALFLGIVVRPQAYWIVSECVSAGISLHAWLEEAAARAAGSSGAGTLGVGGLVGYSGSVVLFAMPQVLRVARGIAAAMEYLHSRALWHMNLRPASVYIGDALTVKVSDYATSLMEWCSEPSLTTWQSVHGLQDCSPWTAPEILRKLLTCTGTNSCRGLGFVPAPSANSDVSQDRDEWGTALGMWAADVYAFGVILWQLLAQPRRPFDGLTPAQLVVAVGLAQKQLPTRADVLAPARQDLRALVRACLLQTASKRPCFARIVQDLELLESCDTAIENALHAFFSGGV